MKLPPEIEPFLALTIPRELRATHWDNFLRKEWAGKYPELFDNLNYKTALAQKTNHFYEWHTAIQIYSTTGYKSLVGKYEIQYRNRTQDARRYQLFKQIAPAGLVDFILNRQALGYRSAPPDLFVYKPDFTDWYFCEVKGVNDRLSATQIEFFQAIAQHCGRPVKLVKYSFTKPGRSP